MGETITPAIPADVAVSEFTHDEAPAHPLKLRTAGRQLILALLPNSITVSPSHQLYSKH